MESATALLLLCLALAASVRPAPVAPAPVAPAPVAPAPVDPAPVAPAPVDPAPVDPAFREAAERARLLVQKVLRDLPAAHAATVTSQVLTLDSGHTSGLQTMAASLGIPPSPVLKPLSERFPLELCVRRMWAGSRQYQGLLGVLAPRLSGLAELSADLRDLLTHIAKMKEAAQIGQSEQSAAPDLESRLHGDYELQVAVHVTLVQLRSFCHDLMRSLRAVAR